MEFNAQSANIVRNMVQFNTDLEGPITLNDNAFELTSHFLPEGDRFFANLSKYDDLLADVLKRKNYQPGSTLKLILPFFLAFKVTEEKIQKFSRSGLRLVPGAKETVGKISKLMPTFIISTSYEPYVLAVCEYLNFLPQNAYSTAINLCSVKIDESEGERLKEIYRSILALPQIDIPPKASSLEDFPLASQETIQELDQIFWEEIWPMNSGYFLKNIRPVGGKEKVDRILKTIKLTGNNLSQVIYVGDSITDSAALSLVKQKGGLAISFNGNNYALKSCEISIIAGSFSPVYRIAEIFKSQGKKSLLQQIDKKTWGAKVVTTQIDEDLIKESERMRKKLRGEDVAALG